MRRKEKVKTLGLMALFYIQKKKKEPMSLFFIYNFYFENLIYK